MSEEKDTTKRKLRLSRRTFIVMILSICAVALATEIVLLIHSFAKEKAASKASEGENYDGYIWLLVEETDTRLGTCKYEYDDLGRCIRVEYNGFYYADPSLPFCEITNVEYVYQDGEAVTILIFPDAMRPYTRVGKAYFNSSGTEIYYARCSRKYSEETDEYTDELTVSDERAYDENGWMILSRVFDFEGNILDETVYEKDRYGHTILETAVWYQGEHIDRVKLRGVCDSLGRVVETQNGNDELCSRIEYSDEGYIESYFYKREAEPDCVIWYNADGEKIREENDGEVVFLREDTANGYRTIERQSLRAITKEYDQRGLLIAQDYVYYDVSSSQERMNSSRMTYDEDGRLIREETIESDGTKQLIQIKYSFDVNGNLIAEKWTGTDGKKNKTYRYVPVKLSDEQLAERAKFYQGAGIYTRLTERGIYR